MAFGLEFIMDKVRNQPQPRSPYDIRGAGDYGLKMFDPSKTRSMLNGIAQRQIDKDTGRVFRQGVVGGDMNPEVSAYNATQSARDARDRSLVDLDKYAHEDQYKLLQGMLGIDSNKLNREQLDFQKYQYDDSKPSFWSGIADLALGGLNAVFPFEEGGIVGDPDKSRARRADISYPAKVGDSIVGSEVNDEDEQRKRNALRMAIPYEVGGVIPETKDVYEEGGVIPAHMANIQPQETNDNTLIRAKTGEGILTDDTTNVIGGADTINALNKAGEVMKMFSPDFANKIKATASNAGGMAMGGLNTGGNFANFNPNPMGASGMMGLGQKLGGAIKGMFGGGGGSASMPQAFEEGGVTGGDLETLMQEFQLAKQNVDQYEKNIAPIEGLDPVMANQLRQKLINAEAKLRAYQQQNMQAKSTGGVDITGADLNNNGIPDNQEKTITIKTKPIQPKSAPTNPSMQLPPMDSGGGAYINSGFQRPLG